MTKGKPPLVEVEWMDAVTHYESMKIDEVPTKCKLERRFSSGYLVYKDRECVVIAGTFDPAADEEEKDKVDDMTCIPKPWIKALTTMVPSTTEPTE